MSTILPVLGTVSSVVYSEVGRSCLGVGNVSSYGDSFITYDVELLYTAGVG